MSQAQLDPYIFFPGNCKEAMEFYKGIFGGELTMQTYEEAGMSGGPNSEGKIMHSTLKGGLVGFMASDSTAHDHFEMSCISLSISGTDEAALREAFDKLSEGGKVTQALEKMPWGDLFGGVTDKYGIDWMVDIMPQA